MRMVDVRCRRIAIDGNDALSNVDKWQVANGNGNGRLSVDE